MLKKYAPYIVLLMAAVALLYVKTHQRGSNKPPENITVQTDAVNNAEGFNRNPVNIIYTKHARCRMDCRHITEDEVRQILQTGKLRTDKIQQDDKGFTYPLDGRTKEDKMVRVVVAPKKNDIVVVTVIDLDTDWPCGDCK